VDQQPADVNSVETEPATATATRPRSLPRKQTGEDAFGQGLRWSSGLLSLPMRQTFARVATTLALVFLLFVLIGKLDLVTALICWGFTTLAVVWPTLANTDLVPESEPALSGLERGALSTVSVSDGLDASLNWRTVIDAVSDPAFVIDANGDFAHLNPLFIDLFPRARLGQPLVSTMRSPALVRALDTFELSEPHAIVQIEDRVPVLRSWSAIITALGIEDPTAAPSKLVVLRDLTAEQRHAQLRSDFISHASHELRTPLASLKGMVETLQGNAYSDAAARDRFLAMMQTQATRMTRLIDDLLTLSRAEMKVHLPPQDLVDLREVLADVADSLEPLVVGSESEIRLSIETDAAVVRGDREDLLQIFQNLIQNAIKYGHEGRPVCVRLADDDAGRSSALTGAQKPSSPMRVMVQVTDESEGIAPEHLTRLTERFYRTSVSASRRAGGTGLGLAIVKYLVSRHRGDLRIESQIGVGSTFTVSINRVNTKPSEDSSAGIKLL